MPEAHPNPSQGKPAFGYTPMSQSQQGYNSTPHSEPGYPPMPQSQPGYPSQSRGEHVNQIPQGYPQESQLQQQHGTHAPPSQYDNLSHHKSSSQSQRYQDGMNSPPPLRSPPQMPVAHHEKDVEREREHPPSNAYGMHAPSSQYDNPSHNSPSQSQRYQQGMNSPPSLRSPPQMPVAHHEKDMEREREHHPSNAYPPSSMQPPSNMYPPSNVHPPSNTYPPSNVQPRAHMSQPSSQSSFGNNDKPRSEGPPHENYPAPQRGSPPPIPTYGYGNVEVQASSGSHNSSPVHQQQQNWNTPPSHAPPTHAPPTHAPPTHAPPTHAPPTNPPPAQQQQPMNQAPPANKPRKSNTDWVELAAEGISKIFGKKSKQSKN
ncbi:hypothetical protein BGZ76_001565 [Entomortierella beljakovae]|nr:hypothetical protein BGZ76_001565 [Entomortierella beljakovae]